MDAEKQYGWTDVVVEQVEVLLVDFAEVGLHTS